MVDQIFESAELSFYIGGSALLGEPRNGDCVRRGRPVAEYMYCDAEEAVEATKKQDVYGSKGTLGSCD